MATASKRGRRAGSAVAAAPLAYYPYPLPFVPALGGGPYVYYANVEPPSQVDGADAAPPAKKPRHPPEDRAPTKHGGIPFALADHPELALDADPPAAADGDDGGLDLVRAFRAPLFGTEVATRPLAIAYSHRAAAVRDREEVRRRRRAVRRELCRLRDLFHAQKAALARIDDELREDSDRVRAWTRKVFELELEEPACKWNDQLRRLRAYVAEHGDLPSGRVGATEEECSIANFVAKSRTQLKSGHRTLAWHPHRVRALEACGVRRDSEKDRDARFEEMFAKLLEYRREHGTFRLPSLDLCKAANNPELVALHRWVFSQVCSFRYHLPTKNVATVKRFLDAGFSFERWYAHSGHTHERNTLKFDDIFRRYVENGGVLDKGDADALEKWQKESPQSAQKEHKKRSRKKKEAGKGRERQEEGGSVQGEETTAAVADIAEDEEEIPELPGPCGIGVELALVATASNRRAVGFRALDPRGPAHRAGLQAGDVIVAVDAREFAAVVVEEEGDEDAATALRRLPDAVARAIRGTAGSVVSVTVDRGEKRQMFVVKREPLGWGGEAAASAAPGGRDGEEQGKETERGDNDEEVGEGQPQSKRARVEGRGGNDSTASDTTMAVGGELAAKVDAGEVSSTEGLEDITAAALEEAATAPATDVVVRCIITDKTTTINATDNTKPVKAAVAVAAAPVEAATGPTETNHGTLEPTTAPTGDGQEAPLTADAASSPAAG